MMAGCEAEFFLFEKAPDGAPDHQHARLGAYFDLGPMDKGEEIRRVIVEHLVEMGFEVEAAHHEVATGTARDRLPLRRRAGHGRQPHHVQVRGAATWPTATAYVASFMPKPIEGVNGSGMHTHQSLFRGKENAFYDPKGEYQLSRMALSYIEGLLQHARGFCAITNPLINSYKRLVPGYEAPVQRGVVDAEPLAAGPDSRPPRARHALRAPDARSVVQSLPGADGAARGRARRHRAEARGPRAGAPQHLHA